MKVALYARVSTTNGHQDPEVQLRELREHCLSRGWTITKEYVDRASGSKQSRPALDDLLAAAAKHRFDAVLVWKLDRFGRSLIHLATTVARFQKAGVAFISLKDGFDLTTSNGRLQFNMLASFAEFERDLIRERVKAGLRNAKAKGKVLGHPCGKVNPRFVERAKKLHECGQSFREVAKRLGVSHMTIYGIVKRPS